MRGRLLFLAPQPFFRLRGMCLAQLECLTVLSEAGVQIHVLCPPGGRPVVIPGVRFIRLPCLPFLGDIPIGFSWTKVAYGVVMAAWAAALSLRERYDAVHACEESAFIGAFLKMLFGTYFVYDMDEVLSRRLRAGGLISSKRTLSCLRLIERWMTRRADAILTNSRETDAYARHVAGAGRTHFYDHAPPASAARAPRPSRESRLRRILGAEGAPLALYAGNFHPYQGHELLLAAWSRVLRRMPDARLTLVGGDGARREELESFASSLGLTSSVIFTGARGLALSAALMETADVLVSPMVEVKAVPMKLYAYLRAGRPIVATDLPNHRQLLDDDCALLPAPTAEHLADALFESLANPEAAAARAGRARKRTAARFEPGACRRALGAAYASLPASRRLPEKAGFLGAQHAAV